MTIQEVIDRIYAYHPVIPNYNKFPIACDGVKFGNPEQECTGIVTSIAPSIEVIMKTIKLGCNLIYVHEPSFYTHMDPLEWLENNKVFQEKAKLLRDHDIVIFRDHDHIHAHKPDGIFYGVMKELGWEDYLISEDINWPMDFRIPKTNVRELSLFLKEKLGLNAVRIVGNIEGEASRVLLCTHLMSDDDKQRAFINRVDTEDIDVLVPLEYIDWTTVSYIRDAGQLGKNKAMILVGHMNGEELGDKWAVNWLKEITGGQLPINFVRAGDTYQYIM